MKNNFQVCLIQAGYGQALVELMHRSDPTWFENTLLPGTSASNPTSVVLAADWEDDTDEDEVKNYNIIEGIAVLPIRGPMVANENFITRWLGIPSYEGIRNDLLTAAEDPEVTDILFDVATPGGSVVGISDLSDLITEVRGIKNVYTHASGDMMSAGMWLFTNSSGVWASRTSMVGSIGAIMMHISYEKALKAAGVKVTEIKSGKWKATGSPHFDLSEEEQAYLQSRIDGAAELFYEQMALNRPAVDRTTFDGSTYLAADAETKGMLDGVQSFDQSVREVLSRRPKGTVATAPDYHTGGVSAADSTGEVEMKKNKKKAMIQASYEERKAAAIAAGADPEKVDELLKAEDGTQDGTNVNDDTTNPEGGTAADPGTEGTAAEDVGTKINLEDAVVKLSAFEEEVSALTASVETLTGERDAALKAVDNQSGLLDKAVTVMCDRLGQMRMALGLTTIDFSDMAPESVLREYESTDKMFTKAFNLSEKSQADDKSTDIDNDAQVSAVSNSVQEARLKAANSAGNK